MKTRYQETPETRMAGLERDVRNLKRRQQIPKNHPYPGAPLHGSYNLTHASAVTHSLNTFAWSHDQGDAPLDLTDPTSPTVVDDGVYAVTLSAALPAGLASGEFGWFSLVMYDTPDFDIFAGGEAVAYQNTITPYPFSATVTTVWQMAAGSHLYATAWNGSASTQTFDARATAVKIV
jgi:hypothetical protein